MAVKQHDLTPAAGVKGAGTAIAMIYSSCPNNSRFRSKSRDSF